MPNFHPQVQDLISHMLVVDPKSRFTIDDIKNHPAFSIGIPNGYILPSPIPLPHLIDPVDPNTLNPQILKTLRQVGYPSDEDLRRDLTSHDHTMAKVFCYMITRSAKLEHLPWDSAQHHKIVVSQVPTENIDFNSSVPKPADLPEDPFHRKGSPARAPEFQPQSIYSIAVTVDWAINEKDTVIYDQEDSIPDIEKTPAQVMALIQKLLSEFDCDWFHPDDLRIIARTKAGTFITFDSAIQDINMITLFVHMNHGTQDQFSNLMLNIHEIIGL